MINLNNLVNKINLMPNSKEKALEINLLNSYVHFYLETEQISEEEATNILLQINERETFYKHYIRNERKHVVDLYNISDRLNSMYKNILNYANNYDLFSTTIPEVNFEKMTNSAKDFMKYIDKDLLELFNKSIDNGMVFEKITNKYAGESYRLDGKNPGFILRYNNVTLDKMFALVHEMGHVYFYYLEKDHQDLVRSNLTRECLPRILEGLFFEYLKTNCIIDEDIISKYERCFNMTNLSIINSVYIINELLIKGQIFPDFQIEKTEARLKYEDFYNLSIIKPKKNNQQFLNYQYNFYGYAYILSMIIREFFKKDELVVRKFIRDLPIYARELNASEIIDLFDKTDYINATNRNTARVLSKTFYKKST